MIRGRVAVRALKAIEPILTLSPRTQSPDAKTQSITMEKTMKLYDFPKAPNPRRVNIYLAEKGIDVESVSIDLFKGEHMSPEYMAKNPACDTLTTPRTHQW